MSNNGGSICWPEQFPGEYKAAKKAWQKADIEYPNRKRNCACTDNEPLYPCRHCGVCGRFVADVTMVGNEIAGMLAVIGDCKDHGQQCVDMNLWDWEYFQ